MKCPCPCSTMISDVAVLQTQTGRTIERLLLAQVPDLLPVSPETVNATGRGLWLVYVSRWDCSPPWSRWQLSH